MQSYRIRFKPGCRATDIRNLFKMSRLAMEELRGRARIGMTCRHCVSDDGLDYTVNIDNPSARDLAVIFIGMSRRLLGEDCCRVTPTCQA